VVEWPVKGMLLADNAGTLAKDRLSAVKGISTDPSAARSGTLTLQMFYTCTCMLQQLIIKSFVTAGLPVCVPLIIYYYLIDYLFATMQPC